MTLLGALSPAVWAADAKPGLENPGCLECHGAKAEPIEVAAPAAAAASGAKPRKLKAYAEAAYAGGVHGNMACVACHTGITDKPAAGATHAKPATPAPSTLSCADCHEKLWDDAKKAGNAAAKPRLGVVVENVAKYKDSFHARGSKKDRSVPNATCDGCHDTHTFAIPAANSPDHDKWRLQVPATCGKTCHSDSLDMYADSIHGKTVLEKKDPKAAVCSDCHDAHAVGNTSAAPVKLSITANCGSCHKPEYKAYKATYHGQITTLGYAETAKCFDCHGGHEILQVKNKESKVHPNNRMETCETCHNGKKGIAKAPPGFASFQPHARTDDFARYPQVWIGYQIMVGLLLGTFGFFWLHTALWFVRELKDRKAGITTPHLKLDALPAELKGKHFRRFSATWRIAHISFALSLMVLTVTGMPLFYPDAAWAPWVMRTLGGPQVAGTIHRVCAIIFAGVFFWHIVYIGARLWKNRKTFTLFGPTSLVPGLQDLKDIIAMFRWFLGQAPRPVFDRWTYWEKFDYWAPFWGVTIIGVSGLMMWLPHVTGSFLPGWVFNVAAIFHGEEAFLAVVFLFTVHFFNNHFRPDKFPVEIVMFTGTMPLEHYRKEHPLEVQRLMASGELQQHIVEAPSAPMTTASKVLGFVLIATGLILLFGVAVGFFSG